MTDFFNPACQYPAINAVKFGLCDDVTRGAYPDVSNPEDWIATVVNDNQRDVVVTAIDKCVITDGQLLGVTRCDAMLTTSDTLYLVELKNKDSNWVADATAQLLSTVDILYRQHALQLSSYTKKKAFACNKRRPSFQIIQQEEQVAFYRRSGFRLDLQAEVVIV